MALEDDDNEVPQLRADTLAILKDFYGERDSLQERFERLKSRAEDDADKRGLSMQAFTEDWNASQFWYTDETAELLARQLLDGASSETAIAVVSAPSVFIQLKNLLAVDFAPIKPEVVLLEYDERFSVFREFVHYDFAHPDRLPESLKGRFDCIICDPPFLSEDCQAKVADTVRHLAHANNPCSAKLVVCTGERMETIIHSLYGKSGIRTTTFVPQHSSGLSNEFRCYANYACSAWKFQ